LSSAAHRRGNPLRTALLMGGLALGMLGLGFASVPLYRIFCQVTGYGGTTQRATQAQLAALADPQSGAVRTVSVRFDSNVAPGMPWRFYPEKQAITVKIGAKNMAVFVARNMSDKPVTGQAAFNVTPDQAGPYFTKIQCFCFTQQTLQPGEEVRMPVLFFVDRKFLDDPDDKDVQEITLSYTFYPVEIPDQQS
jgi:cytochrome c oxidase assembly protein subunit 11